MTRDEAIDELAPLLSADLLAKLRGPKSNTEEVRALLVEALRGKFAHLPNSSDAFAACKAEEKALEEPGTWNPVPNAPCPS